MLNKCNSMDLKHSDFACTSVRCTEPVSSPGGIQYELVIAEPVIEAPKLSSPPRVNVSTEDIEKKLKAAEERRAIVEAGKINFVVEQISHLKEVKEKRKLFNNSFKQRTRKSLEHKMECIKENREAHLKSIQDRVRNHVTKIEEVRKNVESPGRKQIMLEEFNKKLEAARRVREASIKVAKERLRQHVEHISTIKKQMNEALESKRERLSWKLFIANEKRMNMMQEIRDKMKEHARHHQESTTSDQMRKMRSE